MAKVDKPPKNKKEAESINKELAREVSKTSYESKHNKGGSLTKKNKGKNKGILAGMAKIDHLPQNVRDTVPFTKILDNGVIETKPGVFARCYKMTEINFAISGEEEQADIYLKFQELLNFFPENLSWEFTIFNRPLDKRQLLKEIRIPPGRDSLNTYRREYNQIILDAMSESGNSITQDKYLIVSSRGIDSEKAIRELLRLDIPLREQFKRMDYDADITPLSTAEYLILLRRIYQQDETDPYVNTENVDISTLTAYGGSVKDFVAPYGMDFSKTSSFTLGDKYAKSLYLDRLPSSLSTDFLIDLMTLQETMLISLTYERMDKDQATKLVKNQLSTINACIAKTMQDHAKSGVYGMTPDSLETSKTNATELLHDLSGRDQNLFAVTVTVTVFGDTPEQMNESARNVSSVSSRYQCPLKPLKFQQEFCFNTCLPLCRNDIYVDRLFTTESAAILIPFNTNEIHDHPAIYYGLNQTSNSMILYDRMKGDNFNGLIFGGSGSGKSFLTKNLMTSVLLTDPRAVVYCIDVQGEYTPVANGLNGQIIKVAPGNNVHMNPMDLNILEGKREGQNPIAIKTDYIISLINLMLKGPELGAEEISLLDRCIRKIYKPYIDELDRTGMNTNPTKAPTLTDLYTELNLCADTEPGAAELANVLYQYTVGTFDSFGRRTNITTDSRFTVYDIKNLGSGMRELGLFICLNDIWNRMIENSEKDIATWIFIDEFHILLESEGTTRFLKRVWKMARKWLGVPTGITQNTDDLFRNEDTGAIFKNTNFMLLLKSALEDRQNLQELLNLSDDQVKYITNSERGTGLIYTGKVVLPFKYKFPKDTELYKMFTTSHDV